MEKSKAEIYKIDASGKVLGRLAVEVAGLLRGKGRPDFQPYIDPGNEVVVFNIENMKVTGKKMKQKKYHRHTGYYGGIKTDTLSDLMEKRPEEVIVRAVKGMLPKNRLADRMIRRVKVLKGEIQ